MSDFEIKIKEARLQKGLSQTELAKEMSISRQAVSQFESGKVIPTIERLVEIAQILNVTLNELVEFKKIHSEYSEELSNIK
jgi:transcriptional regulator with XRE-family HTH domain